MSTPAPISSYFIDRDLPSDWTPVNIVYCKIRVSLDDGYLNFKMQPDSRVFDETDIAVFLDKLAKGETGDGRPPNRLSADRPRGALDIDVDDRCYVVVELDKGSKWQFNSSGVGMTTKGDYGASNAQLRHFRKTDTGYEPLRNVAPGPGCTLVYFSVVSRAAMDKQGFNYHLELAQSCPTEPLKMLGVVLDPDVGNGSKIPPGPQG